MRQSHGFRYDNATGAIAMDAEVLFRYNSAVLRPEAGTLLARFAHEVLPSVLSQPHVVAALDEIVVEGHTDTVGSFLFNVELSQRRARAVTERLVAEAPTDYDRRTLQALLVATGRSESKPVKVNGTVSDSLSRRIEIRFRFTDGDIVRELLQRLAGDGR
jgi:chemotaxis protein MotB